jgi:hypothetical protein
MSFLRHKEIYRSDVRLGFSWERQLVVAAPALIGCDEFPVGYSLAGCPPAEPASASPTGDDSQQSTLPYNDFSANGNYPLNFLSQSKGALQLPVLPSLTTVRAGPHTAVRRVELDVSSRAFDTTRRQRAIRSLRRRPLELHSAWNPEGQTIGFSVAGRS